MSSINKNYSRIMKSSALIGGAQGINMLVGIFRVKFAAILIGPIGVGLVSTYQAIIEFLANLFGLGLKSSAVREIAEAVGREDSQQIARSVITLRRMCLLTGVIGLLTVVLFSKQLSQITFNNTEHVLDISFIGLAILFANIQGGQMALIQGMRRIGDLAKVNVIGVSLGSIISVVLYATMGLKGIIPGLVSLAFIQLVSSWFFARKVQVDKIEMTWVECFQAAGGMIKLGLAFMWGALLTTGVAFATRTIIAREIDLVAVGIFSAAYGLSGMVVNFILSAMGADYYPSLTAVCDDHKQMRELVNQQTEIGILLALPGLLATLALAPFLIWLFYSAEFASASDLLQWFAMGCMLRVVSWPMGFVILAKGMTKLFAFTQTLFNTLHIIAIWGFLALMGVEGTAIAFLLLYLFHVCLVLFISYRVIRFTWSRDVQKMLFVMFVSVSSIFAIGTFLPVIIAMIIGGIITIGVSVYCLRGLLIRLGTEHRICKAIIRICPYCIKFLSFS